MLKLRFAIILIVAQALLAGVDKGRVSGYLRDTTTGEPLMYANVVLVNTDFGAASSTQGYYVISDIPPGQYTLRVMILGLPQCRTAPRNRSQN